MALIQLIGILFLVGILLWALNYLFKEYIDAKILDIINKIAIVAIIIYVAIWFLQLFGVPIGVPQLR